MKKEIFTSGTIVLPTTRATNLIAGLFVLLFVAMSNIMSAQNCPLACDDLVQVSVDRNCEATITVDMMLEESYDPACDYRVVVFNTNGLPLPTNVVNEDHIDKTLTVAVYLGANSCWGSILVEDKLPPVIDCPPFDTVGCNELSYTLISPFVTDNCSERVSRHVYSDVTVKYPCDSVLAGKRTVSYYYTDRSGNHSDTCHQMVWFRRIDPDSIDWPIDVIYDCTDVDTIPLPVETGYPTDEGFPLDDINGICKIGVTFQDQVLDVCPGSYKVLRTWTVVDWCKPSPRNVYKHIQIIKVIDTTGPEIYCQSLITVSTDPQSCTGTVILPAPDMDPLSECSDTTVLVGYKFGGATGTSKFDGAATKNVKYLRNGLYSIYGLPLGSNWVIFRVLDECGNYTDCETEVIVIDKVPPIAICDQKTTVALGIDGIAKVDAFTFDDGSHDNCGVDRYEVKRMDDGAPCRDSIYGPYWNPYGYFCCEDVGKTLMVSMRVWDKFGNSNTCMVEVEVQDKIPPTIIPLPNITVQCDYDFPDLKVFGTIRTNAADRKPIVINHPSVRFDRQPIDGYAFDGCGVVVEERPFYDLHCNTGYIYRTFTATDRGGLVTSYTQIITLVGLARYNVKVTMPDKYESNTTCTSPLDVHPSVTGYPRIDSAGKCSNITYTWDDLTFYLDHDACLKIIRTWTVIDWCVYDIHDPRTKGYWTGKQEIKIINRVAPVFRSSCADRTVDAFGPGCGGHVDLIPYATDDCTDSLDLIWTRQVDLYNNGSIDTSHSGSGRDASRYYPYGTHRITFYVRDGCNNETKCSFLLTVRDGKKPTPYCLSSITTTVMPSTKSIEIWAKDFNLNSEDNCTPKDSLKFYFLINNRFEKSQLFDCSNIGINTLRIYVVDQAGNSDYCEVQIDIQDPNNVCPTGITVQGKIISAVDNKPLPGVTAVWQRNNPQGVNQTYTNAAGEFMFRNITPNMNYTFKAERPFSPALNGVTTQDIIMIQKHILNQLIFNKPYQYVAADVNNSCSITAADMSEIRKLILGKIADFSQVPSWKFLASTAMPSTGAPACPHVENIVINSISRNQTGADFYGIKMGDVSGDSDNNGANKVAGRNAGLELLTDDVYVNAGDILNIPMSVAKSMKVSGLQLNFAFLKNSAEVLDIQFADMSSISDDAELTSDGVLVLHAAKQDVQLNKNETCITITVKALVSGKLSEMMKLSNEIIGNELYDENIQAHDLTLKFRSAQDASANYQMYQNRPNPFSEETTIGFEIPKDQKVEFIISQMNGKVIYKTINDYSAGYNELILNRNQLGATGVLYVQMNTPEYTETKRIILIR